MTLVEGSVVRSISEGMYADITGPDVRMVGFGPTYLEFDGDLTPEQVSAIRDRMGSKDDADQAARAGLRALVDAAEDAEFDTEGFEAVRALAVAAMRYWLGD